MEPGIAKKRGYFARGVNESLLELAAKLREAEVRVNGHTLQTAVPPCSILSDVSSSVDGGRFQFIARRNHVSENFPSSDCIDCSDAVINGDSTARVVATNGMCASDDTTAVQQENAEEPVNTPPRKLSMPNRSGPSLWPFLSSIKTSFDAEHVRFLEKNQHFYSKYRKSRIAYAYTEPLSENDFEIVIDNAIDTVLQTHESRGLQQLRSGKNESYVSTAVSVAPKPPMSMNYVSTPVSVAPVAPLSMNYMSTGIPVLPNPPLPIMNYMSRPVFTNPPLSVNYMTTPVSVAPMAPLSINYMSTGISVAPNPTLSMNYMSASVPVTPATPLSMNTDVDVPSASDTDSMSTTSSQPAVVSKRYAAAIANPRRFKCGLCPYSTNNRSHVRRHHISVHSDARPYRCYVCDKEFARCENAKVHMVSRHPDVPYSVERLRNSMFFKPDNNSSPPKSTRTESEPPTRTQSSVVSGDKTAFQMQQDVGSCGATPQWPSDALDVESKRTQLDHHEAVPPWLSVPKIEPKLEQSLPVPMLGHGNIGNQLLPSIPHSMLQSPGNTVLNIQSLLGTVGPVKQEPGTPADTEAAGCPVSDPHVCLYCQFVCHSATELAKHISASHNILKPALPVPPSSNPGYVVLQTAAPIFLFPYGSDSMLPNRSQLGLGYHPILPKVPVHADECQSESIVGQHAAGTVTPQNVPNANAASIGSTPDKAQQSQPSSSTPVSSEGKRERKRQFKTFYCSRCPDRAPFRYEKSFEKHQKQHRFEDRARRAQKITSKVA